MSPHPLPTIISKTMKWGGAAVTVLLLAAWIISGFASWDVVLGDMTARIGIGSGQISIDYSPYDNDFGMDWRGFHAFEHFWFIPPWVQRHDSGVQWGAFLPLWAMFAASLLATLAAWRQDAIARRVRMGQCLKCGYDRAGLAPGGVCPECGAAAGERQRGRGGVQRGDGGEQRGRADRARSGCGLDGPV